MHKVDDQRAVDQEGRSTSSSKFWGRPPRGWFGPGLTQTFDTLDYLSQAGIEYIGDWVLDDEPVTLKTTHKPVVALPYNFELHDIVMMALQNHTSDEMYRRAMDRVRLPLRGIRRTAPRSCRSRCIPICPVDRTASSTSSGPSKRSLSKPGVACWSGEKILDWYLGTQKDQSIMSGFFVPHDLKAPLKGAANGPLAGLTAVVKDMYDIAGERTGGGNPDWLANATPGDSTLHGGARSCSRPARPSPARPSATSSSTASPA